MKYYPGWSGLSTEKYTVNAGVEFDEEPIWPDNITVSIDVYSGTLTVYSGDTLYARLNKQHDITNVARLLAVSDEQ